MANRASTSLSPVMRKSCQFCRARKIRCSGHRICTTCRSRNLDCTYGREGLKGRPRGASNKTGNSSRSANEVPHGGSAIDKPSERVTNESVRNSSDLFNQESSDEVDWTWSSKRSIAAEMEAVFQHKFIDNRPSPGCQHSAHSTASFTRSNSFSRQSSDSSGPVSALQASTACTDVAYQRLFFGITQGLVELTLTHYGSLGYYESDGDPTRVLAASLMKDDTSNLFGSQSHGEPMPQHNDHEIRQLIELWFIHHPLSIILSKTLLIHDYRRGCPDEALLAIMFADASYTLGDQGADNTPKFLDYAIRHVTRRASEAPLLSTIQTMVLLGWHLLCFSSARRGYCYIDYARTAIFELQSRPRHSGEPDDWINGVDLGKVEAELGQRIYWLTFAIELWAKLNFGVPLTEDMLLTAPISFPSIDESTSAVFRLDKESGNVASLRVQEKFLRNLWPLSHIASTIAPIYALFPREAQDQPSRADCWELNTLPKLRRLLKGPSNLNNACQEVRGILSDGLKMLESQMMNHPSQIFTLSAYKILNIHLLFPRKEIGSQYMDTDSQFIADVVQSLVSFQTVLTLADSPLNIESELMGALSRSRNATILMLGLDASGRALNYILDTYNRGNCTVRDTISRHQATLGELAQYFYCASKNHGLQVASTAPLVRKTLKNAKLCFENWQHSNRQAGSDIPIFEQDIDWLSASSSMFLPPVDDVDYGPPDYPMLGEIGIQRPKDVMEKLSSTSNPVTNKSTLIADWRQ